MSFLWGSSAQQTEFDQLVDKCTSGLLPSSEPLDLPAALHLSDLLRSSAIPPPAALKSLLPRLVHTNPNVQLLALALLDVAIKNGGTPFLAQLAKPAAQGGAATDLELIASGRKSGGVNRDVGEMARKLLQEWAAAFKGSGKKELEASELVEVFERLKRDGIEFPVLDKRASAAMVESLSAPDWLDSPYCTRCRTPFSTFNRKHHCRNCGQVFDQACSASVAPLPHYGILEPVRVCDACHRKIKDGKGASVAKEVEAERRKQAAASASSSSAGAADGRKDGDAAASGHSRSKSRKEQEDDDLRRAIEASLAEAAPSQLRDDPPKASGYNPSYASSVADTKGSSSSTAAPKKDEEEDPDLAAAIAASLRDLAPPASAPFLARTASNTSTVNGGEALTYSQLFPRSSGYDTSSSAYPSSAPAPPSKKPFTLPNHDLAPAERSLLDHFCSLPPHAVDRRMYDDVRGQAGLRLDRSMDDTARRVGLLREMEWKLAEAARIYGAGLVERASFQPTLSRNTSYAQPAAPVPPTPLSQHVDPRYLPQSSSFLAGQPLPSYAVPSAAAALPSPLPPVAQAAAQPYAPPQQQQQYTPPVQQQQQQQPAGFYKPSQFPAVPSALPPTGLATLPAAPQGVPGRREEESEDEEEEERVKEGELIEF
ncbi:hypothetical protein JCM6882_001283 [Rhodosporidiobolus microsporus]